MKKLTDDDGNKDMTVHFLSLGVGAYTSGSKVKSKVKHGL
jgi:hypothetical protein